MMMKYLETLTAFLALHPYLAYAAAFLAALLEAVPVAGVVVPGSVIIIGLGALVPIGVIDLWPAVISAVAGAVAGDGVSYWLGRRYQRQILTRWPFSRYKFLESRSEAFFQAHGAKSVFLGRFIPALRAFIPLFAGIMRMPAGRFYSYNILSAFLWAPAHIIPGVLLGASLGMAGAVAGRLATITLLLFLLLWAAVWSTRYAMQNGGRLLASFEDRMRYWSAHPAAWRRRLSAVILRVIKREHRAVMLAVSILTAALWLFLGLLEDVLSGDPLVRLDRGILELVQSVRTPLADAVMVAVTEIGDSFVVIAVAGTVLLWLLASRAWRTAAYWLGAVALSSLFNTLIKATVYRSRPAEGLYVGLSDLSFPSGHATVNAAMYVFLGFLIVRELTPARRLPVIAAVLSLVVLIAFSRVYLGAHWFSDAIAGTAFGTAWCTFMILAYTRQRREALRPLGLSAAALLAIIVAGGWHIATNFSADLERYAVRHGSRTTLAAADWQSDGWNRLPAFRTDIAGEREEPLNIQWAGDIEVLRQRLMPGSWQDATPWSGRGMLNLLVPEPPADGIPVVAKLEDGRFPALVLATASSGDTRYVLRLWPVLFDVEDTQSRRLPLYVGSVTKERIDRYVWLISWPRTELDRVVPMTQLQTLLPGAVVVQRKTEIWNGNILLAMQRTDPSTAP